ncbi:competence protein ComFC [Paenibacillus sp. V4I9]|uniref:ComF family protein n=1 Tax=Paenibacillus sp. V4I9 TaxID=3042308 RepID=UPI0027861C2E|nr:ComF family protein [Paenibacillus sp. V4I9]MDQ0891962.1 competence protein ComFC [Paenibacillus sp. V4I9]
MSYQQLDLRILIKKVMGSVASLLSPLRKACLLCKQNSTLHVDELGLCHSCYTRIPWIREALCPTCGRGEFCSDCQRRPHSYFIRSRSAVRYDETMKELLARYKYRGDEHLKVVLGQMIVHSYHLLQMDRLMLHVKSDSVQELITFVPVSERRMLERGFNQAEQMAVELGKRMGLPVVPLLTRSKHTDKQSFKKRSERLDDLEHVFELSEAVHDDMYGSPASSFVIYIVDDVYTTGSTMNQCAKVLREYFSAEIFGLTWAR